MHKLHCHYKLIAVVMLCLPLAQVADVYAESIISFTPPSEDLLPADKFGDLVRAGKDLFVHTDKLRGTYVGNNLKCVNCHLDAGRLANSAPLWAAYVAYPAFRKKTNAVNTFEERLQGCFEYSMNGSAPPAGSPELTALTTYSYWLASGAPVGKSLPGRGYPKLEQAGQTPSIARGAKIYAEQCVICHGEEGDGTDAEGATVFPPLWGKNSFNWGAGMHRVDTAASFIKANMPLSKPNSLSDQQAWDVASFVNSHERPQDPRFKDDVAVTKEKFHAEACHYGERIDGHVLGAPKP